MWKELKKVAIVLWIRIIKWSFIFLEFIQTGMDSSQKTRMAANSYLLFRGGDHETTSKWAACPSSSRHPTTACWRAPEPKGR